MLPARDYAAMRERLLAMLDRHAAKSIRLELQGMGADVLRRDPASTRVIHGDLNFGNVHFANGCVSGFLEL